MLAVADIVKKLNVNKETVYRWLRGHKLTGLRAGRLWRVREEDLESFLQGTEPEHGGANDSSSPEQLAGSVSTRK